MAPQETGYILTSAFRACKKKAFKKNFASDKVSNEEKDQFTNCILKYIQISEHSKQGLIDGLKLDKGLL